MKLVLKHAAVPREQLNADRLQRERDNAVREARKHAAKAKGSAAGRAIAYIQGEGTGQFFTPTSSRTDVRR
jgi:hypothetical protein